MVNLKTTPLSSFVVVTVPTPDEVRVSVTLPTFLSLVVAASSVWVVVSFVRVGEVTVLFVSLSYDCADIWPLLASVSVTLLIILSELAMAYASPSP